MTRSPANPRPVRRPLPLQQAAVAGPGPCARRRRCRWRWRPGCGPPRRRSSPRGGSCIVQLDHLGDAVLTSPLLARLRAAYPEATIDVLASPSNHEVFEADPNVDRVRLAERTWFERRPRPLGAGSAVWQLGRSLRGERYDLGIDVRGDILTVLVLALAGIPRRVGWAMGGGGFLLTDVADWVPGRHEVRSRLALLEPLGIAADGPARVVVHVDRRRPVHVARWLREAWPRRASAPSTAVEARRAAASRTRARRLARLRGPAAIARAEPPRDERRLAARRAGSARGPAAGRPPRRRDRGQAMAAAALEDLIERFLADGWRVVVVGGPEDAAAASACSPPHEPPRLDRAADASPRRPPSSNAPTCSSAPIGPVAPGGVGRRRRRSILFSGTNRPASGGPGRGARSSCATRPLPALPPEDLPAGRPPLHGRPRPRPRLPRRPAMVGADTRRSRPTTDLNHRTDAHDHEPRRERLDTTSASASTCATLSSRDLVGWIILAWVWSGLGLLYRRCCTASRDFWTGSARDCDRRTAFSRRLGRRRPHDQRPPTVPARACR